MNRAIQIIAATALSTTLLLGCGAAAEKVSEKATEKAIEDQTGGNVDIDTSGDGSVDIETEEGSMSFGNGEIPADWPEEIPLPDDFKVQSGSTIDAADGRLVSVVGGTDQTPEEVLASLKEALADWTISGEVISTSNGSAMTGAQWDTEGRRVTFAATSGSGMGGEETFVTLGHTTLG